MLTFHTRHETFKGRVTVALEAYSRLQSAIDVLCSMET